MSGIEIAALAAAGLTAAGGASEIVTGLRAKEVASKLGAQEAARVRREGVRILGAQRAAFAKAGVAIDVGTPMDVLEVTAKDAAQESERRRAMFKFQGEQEMQAHVIKGVSTILGGAISFGTSQFGGSAPPLEAVQAGGSKPIPQFPGDARGDVIMRRP